MGRAKKSDRGYYSVQILTLLSILLFLAVSASGQESDIEEASEMEQGQAIEEPGVAYPNLDASGHIQIQLSSGDKGSGEQSNVFPENNGLAPFQAEDRIFVRRFRPSFKVNFSEQFNLDTEFQITPREGWKIQIFDAILNYKFTDDTKISGGRFKVPFGWEGLRSSQTINTIERSDVTVFLYPERDVGLALSHNPEGVGDFSLGTFLGQARSNGDSNGQYDVVGRASFDVTDQLKIGASGHFGTFRITGTQGDLPVRRLDGELQWEDGPFRFESEAIYSDGFNVASKADTRAFGYYFSTIYRIVPSLDFVLSYDRFDPDLDSVDASFPDNAENSRDRKVIGLNYYVSRDPAHRLMLNYELRQSLEGAPFSTRGFRFRYQYAW